MITEIQDDLQTSLKAVAERLENTLNELLPDRELPEARLYEAMRHATLDGGKRLRAFMVVKGAKMFGVEPAYAYRTAAALECLHAYSLVHDDLPCMDDGRLRRGKPTVHVAFDEAMAVLAGDALQSKAFEILANPATHHDAGVRCQLISALAQAAGASGMVGGQVLDMLGEEEALDAAGVTRMERMKTGELIAFAGTAGAILGQAPAREKSALKMFSHDIGLAFQIVDDLLDVEGREEEMGKAVKQDAQAEKSNFVAVLGLERARAQAKLLTDQAIRHLDSFGARADLHRQLAKYMLDRRF
ncbi:MAG: polyprenyl synthetase family protein [Alphaproteobacteria bacterium]